MVEPMIQFLTEYGYMLLLAWVLAEQFGFPLLTVRATNVYGARQQLFKIIPRSVVFVRLGKTRDHRRAIDESRERELEGQPCFETHDDGVEEGREIRAR